eukprot:gnl/MRDRNA2_/MRDRNA2_285091_c0_seq1.p1 gnl/MRDRNA2_/MRDRNA2_285091_c0~~gnl/MRDRNA2_/MRDRNA2_285091_c0_seq1.p1  ORF type:complete len:135 (-),score=24.78 gnl/MRDRNA2_/MRDRNA2_285091_c0_seq1:107-511(-)
MLPFSAVTANNGLPANLPLAPVMQSMGFDANPALALQNPGLTGPAVSVQQPLAGLAGPSGQAMTLGMLEQSSQTFTTGVPLDSGILSGQPLLGFPIGTTPAAVSDAPLMTSDGTPPAQGHMAALAKAALARMQK